MEPVFLMMIFESSENLFWKKTDKWPTNLILD